MATAFEADDDPSAALYAAAERGDSAGVMLALRAGGDPNVASSKGATPLALAAYAGNRELSMLLINFGAELTDMAVEAALAHGHISLAEVLRTQATITNKTKARRADVAKQQAHSSQVEERRARLAVLEREHERRERGEKLAHQMAKSVDHQIDQVHAPAIPRTPLPCQSVCPATLCPATKRPV